MVKRTIQLLTFVFVALTINAQNIWEDTNITQVNAEKAHATYIPFNKPSWENNRLEDSEQVQMLNGEWKFRYFENPGLVPQGISNESINSNWDNITVPSNWQLQNDGKYDPPYFTNS